MSEDKVLYERVGDVAWIRLNDPATLNAMGTPIGEGLIQGIARAEGEARAIVLGAVGRGFCSGANLAEGGIDLADPQRDVGLRLETLFNPLLQRMRLSPLPIVTAVRGPAVGVGCGIALAGDLIVAGDAAYFYQAFSKLGLAPDGGSSYLLSKAIGRVRAMEMMLLGEKLSAPRALDWGLINRVVPEAEVDDAALALAKTLAEGPASLAAVKRLAWAGLDSSIDTALAAERFAQREACRTEDFAEGVAGFREKRKPRFRGK
jgi:2-(1,2-epoxy-1,2-dihydrophenyl)acetyl-CoA isomerase